MCHALSILIQLSIWKTQSLLSCWINYQDCSKQPVRLHNRTRDVTTTHKYKHKVNFLPEIVISKDFRLREGGEYGMTVWQQKIRKKYVYFWKKILYLLSDNHFVGALLLVLNCLVGLACFPFRLLFFPSLAFDLLAALSFFILGSTLN